MNFKTLTLTLSLLIPGALNAMEGTAETMHAPQTLLLPTLKVVMKLFDPRSPADELWTRRACQAKPSRDGIYDIHEISVIDNKGPYFPLLTSIQIDPANPPAPIITYRFVKISAITSKDPKARAYQASDFQLSVPYDNPRTLNVELETQTLNLEILIKQNN